MPSVDLFSRQHCPVSWNSQKLGWLNNSHCSSSLFHQFWKIWSPTLNARTQIPLAAACNFGSVLFLSCGTEVMACVVIGHLLDSTLTLPFSCLSPSAWELACGLGETSGGERVGGKVTHLGQSVRVGRWEAHRAEPRVVWAGELGLIWRAPGRHQNI